MDFNNTIQRIINTIVIKFERNFSTINVTNNC